MRKKELEKKLESKIGDISWTYTFRSEEKTIEFVNVKVESADEEDFLRSLKEDGVKQTVEGGREVSSLISRCNGNLWLRLIDKGKPIGEPKEITEKDALRIFRESKKPSGGIFSIFKERKEHPKELVPNRLMIKYEAIEKVDLKSTEKTKLLNIVGKRFHIELRSDGGCRLNFPNF